MHSLVQESFRLLEFLISVRKREWASLEAGCWEDAPIYLTAYRYVFAGGFGAQCGLMVWASPLLFVPYVGRLPAPQPVLQLAPAVESRPAAPPAARSRSTGGAAAWISVPIVALAVASSARQSDEPSTELEKRQRILLCFKFF